MSKNKLLFPFILVCTLFFLWAFLHNINGILIPHLKKVCQLSDTQSSFIDFAVYLGYFVFAGGGLLFLPGADGGNYSLFLVALFVAASGATFLETVANPYAANMGS